MRYGCAFRQGSTNPKNGKNEPPEKCKKVNCIGIRNVKRGQSMKDYCKFALPDPETIMKINGRPKTPIAKEEFLCLNTQRT